MGDTLDAEVQRAELVERDLQSYARRYYGGNAGRVNQCARPHSIALGISQNVKSQSYTIELFTIRK